MPRCRHLIAEAGNGKSFAYLLPAALYADRHQGEGPIVISTRTIALHEQLEQKDLPFLHAMLPFEWSSVTAPRKPPSLNSSPVDHDRRICSRQAHPHSPRDRPTAITDDLQKP